MAEASPAILKFVCLDQASREVKILTRPHGNITARVAFNKCRGTYSDEPFARQRSASERQ